MSVTLVAVVGAGKWERVEYVLQGWRFETDFSPHALHHFFRDEVDKFVFFGTEGSKWDVVCRYFSDFESVLIPEGRDGEEIKQVTKIFMENLRGGVILDLTHGFRHHPMLLLLTAFTLSLLGRCNVLHAFYAMLPLGERRAEFLDLSQYLTALEAFFSAETFRATFYAARLKELRERVARRKKGATQREREVLTEITKVLGAHVETTYYLIGSVVTEITKVLGALERLVEYLKVGSGLRAVEKAKELSKFGELSGVVSEEFPLLAPPLELFLEEAERIKKMEGVPLWGALLNFSEMLAEKEHFIPAIVFLREGLLTYGCYKMSGCKVKKCVSEACPNWELRESLSGILTKVGKGELRYDEIFELCQLYNEIANWRNAMAHAFMRKSAPEVKKVGERLSDLQKRYRGVIK